MGVKTGKIVNVQGLDYYWIDHEDIPSKMESFLKDAKIDDIVFHWSAGGYSTYYAFYQNLIVPGGVLVSSNYYSGKHQHTWKRNWGQVAISFMAMAKGFPVTDEMVEIASKVSAVLQKRYSLDWEDFKTHAHFARLDGYSSLRWDTELKWHGGQLLNHAIVDEAKMIFTEQVILERKEPIVKESKPLYPGFTPSGEPLVDIDYERHWASPYIDWCVKNGILVGMDTPEGRAFKPDEPVTRSQFAVGLYKFAKKMNLLTEENKINLK